MEYILITPARNEEAFIQKTLESVCSQTQFPLKWVIVNDGSTDRTAEIVEGFTGKYPWIQIIHRDPRAERSFAGKASAVNAALEQVESLSFDVVGNLDADVSFEPGYMSFLMEKFSLDSKLGVAGTPFTQEGGYDSTKDSFEGDNYVAGPCQLFRYDCWKEIGGYVENKAGGVDWIAVMTARMKGWTVRAFPEKRFHHHRSMGTAERSALSAIFSYGEKDYYLGGSPIWIVFRSAFRMSKKPYILGGLALFFGYMWAAITRTPRPVSPELVRFHRRDQMSKLKKIFGSLVRGRKINSFSVSSEKKSN